MRMHWFKTPSEANQTCFVLRSLATLSINPVEVSRELPWLPSEELGAVAGQHCFPQPGPSFQRGRWKVTVSAACVTDCPDYSDERAQSDTFLFCFKASARGSYYLIQFSSFEEALIHRCLDLPGHLRYPVVLVNLPHDLGCRQVLLLTGHRSLYEPRTARQWLIYCILPLLATQWALLTVPGGTEKVDTTPSPLMKLYHRII